MELALDGNPISTDDPHHVYRQSLVDRIRTLRHLDLKRITDEERRQLHMLSRQEEERKKEMRKQERQNEERMTAIKGAEYKWQEDRRRMQKLEAAISDAEAAWNVPGGGGASSSASPLAASHAAANGLGGGRHGGRQQKGFSEVEVADSSRKLCLYGDAFEALENQKVVSMSVVQSVCRWCSQCVGGAVSVSVV
jgi:hypothetical protein